VIRIPSLACAFFLLIGCADPLPEITDVRGPRLLAATVRVLGDDTRSTPMPGETIDVALVVADPGARAARTWSLVVCTPKDSVLDVGVCETVLAGGRLEGPASTDAPRFSFSLPDATTLGENTTLLVHGAVCANGALEADLPLEVFPTEYADSNPCEDDTRAGELFTFEIPIARGEGEMNHAPLLVTTTLDDVPLTVTPPPDAPETGCVALDVPRVVADTNERTLGFAITPDSLESYVDEEGVTQEELPYLAYHATAGEFVGAYAFFDGVVSTTAKWEPIDDLDPEDVPEDGRLVRFWFVLRDGRSGTSYVERAVCLVPATP
jgi:hypothetical protein